MNKTFYPVRDAALLIWVTNYKTNIVNFGEQLNMTAQEIDDEVQICNNIIAAINNANTQRNLLRSANNIKKSVNDTQGGQLRIDIARHKKARLYTNAIGRELDIIGSKTEFDPNEYKPELFLENSGADIQIRFKKLGVQGINIYKRKKGSEKWQLLSRATKSPFEFHPTLENSNQPEQWEFRAFGVINDKEIGLASDISEQLIGD